LLLVSNKVLTFCSSNFGEQLLKNYNMESIISTFHLDLNLFIAQVINFGIVFAVLYYMAFKPLFKTMGDRTKKIEQGLADAKEATNRLENSQIEQAEILKQARTEAIAIIDKANKQAEIKKEEIIAKAKEEVGIIINQEKQKMQQEKSEVLAEIRKESADLIIKAIARILPNKLNSEDEKELVKSLTK